MSKKLIVILAPVCLALSFLAPAGAAQDKPKDTQAKPSAEFKIPPDDAEKGESAEERCQHHRRWEKTLQLTMLSMPRQGWRRERRAR